MRGDQIGADADWIASIIDFRQSPFHPLCSAMPSSVHHSVGEDERNGIIGDLAKAIQNELPEGRLGRHVMLRRLFEALMIHLLRLHFIGNDEMPIDAMESILDPGLAPVLSLIHQQPENPWTVASLADHAHMSRSSFSETFTRVLGVPPLQYLRRYRMEVARRLLEDSSLGLKQIAARTGYRSVSAFSVAFKRATGVAPRDYRQS